MFKNIQKILSPKNIDITISIVVILVSLYVIIMSIKNLLVRGGYNREDGLNLLFGVGILIFSGVLSRLEEITTLLHAKIERDNKD